MGPPLTNQLWLGRMAESTDTKMANRKAAFQQRLGPGRGYVEENTSKGLGPSKRGQMPIVEI